MYQSTLPQRRPAGVTILALLYLLTGVTCLFLLLYLVVFVGILKVHLSASVNMVGTSFVIVEGVVSLIIGIGLWRTQRWGFWASIAKEIVFIVGSLVLLFWFSSIPYQTTQIGYSIIVLAYLISSKNVHRAFLIVDRPKNT